MRWCSAALLVLLFGACGGDDDSASGDSGSRDTAVDGSVGVVGRIEITARDEARRPSPCRVRLLSRAGSPVRLGRVTGSTEVGELIGEGAVAAFDAVSAVACDGLEVPVGFGNYDVVITRGLAFESVTTTARAGDVVEVTLAPVPGFAELTCGDLHVHSAPSFDSDVPMEQRLIGAVAEGLAVVAPTDHDAVGDWTTARDVIGDAPLEVLLGNEITPDHWDTPIELGHVNMIGLPLAFDPRDLAMRGPLGDVLEGARDIAPGALLQLNHPRWNRWNGWFAHIDFEASAAQLEELVQLDLLEVFNGHELDNGSRDGDVDAVLLDWYALLNTGRYIPATGNSDTHRLSRSPAGWPRTCTRGRFVDAVFAGESFVTSGPSVSMRLVSADGERRPGGIAQGREHTLRVTVDAAAFVPLESADVVINGELIDSFLVTRGVEVEVPITVEGDSWVVVVARGDAPLGPEAGGHARPMPSIAFTNPIRIDADMDGVVVP